MVEWWAPPLIIAGTVIGAFGAVYLKKGSAHLSRDFRDLSKNIELFFGVFMYGLSAVFYVAGVRGGELSVIYPLVATSYIWVSLLSVRMLGEKMNKYKWAGILLILLGVSVIGFGSV